RERISDAKHYVASDDREGGHRLSLHRLLEGVDRQRRRAASPALTLEWRAERYCWVQRALTVARLGFAVQAPSLQHPVLIASALGLVAVRPPLFLSEPWRAGRSSDMPGPTGNAPWRYRVGAQRRAGSTARPPRAGSPACKPFPFRR